MNVAYIGVGMMGNGHLRRMLSNPDLQVVAVCDVDEWRLNDARAQVETAYAAETKRGNYKGVCGQHGLSRDARAAGYRCRADRDRRPMACGAVDDGSQGR